MNKRAVLIRLTVVALIVCAMSSLTVFAQDATVATEPAAQPWYLMLYNTLGGVAISFLISFLKNASIVKNHPKLTAMIVSVIATIVPVLAHAPFAAKGAGPIVVSILTQLAAAIGTHEAVTQPLKNATANG
jgi:peptidoglycan/LPS O-acetylase OafA/YrhL